MPGLCGRIDLSQCSTIGDMRDGDAYDLLNRSGRHIPVASTILKPYESRKDVGPFRRFMLYMLLIGIAVFYGLMSAVLPIAMLSFPLTPLILLVALILWMLPDRGGVEQDRMQKLMLAFIGLSIVWPNYVAFDLPGLPWITPVRFAVFTLLAVFVLNFSTSLEFRDRIKTIMNSSPWLTRIFWGFWAATTFSIVFSSQPMGSFYRYMNNQIFWTMMFIVTAFLSTRPGFVMKAVQIMVCATAIGLVAGIYEFRIERVFWLDHLPSFLKVDPEYLERVMKSQARAGTDIYRVRGTMATSLYYSEYLTMMYPLFLHFTVKERRLVPFLALFFGLLACIMVMWMTNARSAMVGLLVASTLYLLFASVRHRNFNPRSIGSNALVFAYPVTVTLLALIVQFWHRAHVMVLGGGQHQASSDARSAQWAMGWPKIFSHPFGFGVGRGGEALGYYNLAGEITVDSHYLSLMLDSGILALPLFLLCFLVPAWFGFLYFRTARSDEEQLIAPLALGLINFCIVKSVLTSEGSVPFAFIMAGCIVGLVWQRKLAAAAIPATGTAVAVARRSIAPGYVGAAAAGPAARA